ncbi:GNAT family N-acetyltransferase [Janibacter sp. G56]|uniref:GNAT family N-acetyltransferase n=1 Tax=Janibacter sp. G56 TaxID=3418717 RepID=UPI003D04F174
MTTGAELPEDSLPPLEPVILEAEEIRLRPWREEDVASLDEPRTDPGHWMPSASVLGPEMFPAWLERSRGYMAARSGVTWCIADARTDVALGHIGLFQRNSPLTDWAELGYQLVPRARGRGVAKAAARLVIAHGRRPTSEGGLGLRRFIAETAADNEASNGVLRSVGFVVFGREHAVDLLPDGTYQDALHWELLP